MRFSQASSRAGSLVALASLINNAAAHSWVEAMNVIGTNGSYVGATGYPRGFVPQSAPGFNDAKMVNLIPPNGRSTGNQILSSDLICKNGSQQQQIQTANYPRLQAMPGANIALLYEENGHATIPQNQPGKPPNRGTVYIYGTTQSQPDDTLLAIHKVWNTAGTGGDKRGKLLSTQNFDDGQCYQINSGPISNQRKTEFPIKVPSDPEGGDLWCQNNLALPQDAPVDKPYTLYWVWDWPTLGADGSVTLNETYTTCMDVDISPESQGTSKDVNYAANQEVQHAALPSYFKSLNQPGAEPSSTMAPASSSVAATMSISTITITSTLLMVPTIVPVNTSTPVVSTRTHTQIVVVPGPPTTAPALSSNCQEERDPFNVSSSDVVCHNAPQKRAPKTIFVTEGVTTVTRSPKPPKTVTHTRFITEIPKKPAHHSAHHKRVPEPDVIGAANPGAGPAPTHSHKSIHKVEGSGVHIETAAPRMVATPHHKRDPEPDVIGAANPGRGPAPTHSHKSVHKVEGSGVHVETIAPKVSIKPHRNGKRTPEPRTIDVTQTAPAAIITKAIHVIVGELEAPKTIVDGGVTRYGPPPPPKPTHTGHLAGRSELKNKRSARFRLV